ncbi:uncharacterized protein zc2hc1c [Misgurnus anguillicaudatus]|uniref:uncharacterized protein zc2hc1c n=1 Tax=Misgurnus anguillicaudatus TaxID=75329 RepID=UPI003CCFAB81
MQMVPQQSLTPNFWEKEIISPKLPFLWREDMSRRPSGTNHGPDQHPWQPSDRIHRKEDIFLEEQKKYIPPRRASAVEEVFPLKPVLHKRAYSLSNYGNVSNSEYQERFHSGLPRLTDQALIRQQHKSVRKPESPKSTHEQLTGRRQTTSNLVREHQEQKFSEKLSKEIHSKEMILQQRFFKAEETLRRIQGETTGRHDRMTREEKNERYLEKGKRENRLYSDEYGHWDDGRDRYMNEKKEISDDAERWEEWERKVNERRKTSRRQLLTSEMTKNHKLKDKREADGYENAVKGRRGEMQDNSWREIGMGMGGDTWDRSEWRNVEEVNKIQREKYDRRREMHSRKEEEQWDMRKPRSSDSRKTDRSYFKQDREHNEGPYEPTLRHSGRRRKSAAEESVPDRNPSQRGNRLLQVELSPEESPDAPQQLYACSVCQRRFLRDRLETHMKVCERKRPQRKIFDTSKHRAKGTDLEEFLKTNGRSRTPEEIKKSNWRPKHESFIQTMRQGRTYVPGGHQPQAVPNLNPEYISCPHCGRKFAPGPADRHIPKCQNIKNRPSAPKQLPVTARRKITR